MKKYLIATAIVISALLAGVYFFIPFKISTMITDYAPFTFETILGDNEMRKVYGIYEKNSPEDYGFTDVEEFTIKSLYDDIKLNAWYLPTSKSSKSIVLIHGRTSNRLKTMKYLELFREAGLDSSYNILIPDMRNSGKSDPSSTFMGYKFAEDLAAYLQYLRQEKQQDTVILYGFSMGAMAILSMVGRPELKKVADDNVHIEKVIMDSPLSNVKATLQKSAAEMNLPDYIFEAGYKQFNERINGFADSMALSTLITHIAAPVLLLQGTADKTTPHEICEDELKKVSKANLQKFFFDDAEHVRAYQNEIYKEEYTKIVGGFINEKP